MLIEVGKEKEYTREELQPLHVETNGWNGYISKFPKVSPEKHVACAFNQFGIAGLAKMYICQSLKDMNELVSAYNKGGALRIDWFTIPDTHFVKIMTLAEWKKSNEQPLRNSFKP